MGTPTDTVQYTYAEASWKDLLTGYDGTAITYDGIGNPNARGQENHPLVPLLRLQTLSFEVINMIAFKGHLTGPAERRFYWKGKVTALKMLPSVLLVLPIIIYISTLFSAPIFLYISIAVFAILPLTILIPPSKQERISLTPNLIYIEDNHIVCIAEKYEEIRKLSDIKRVIDRGEYYEIDFPYGKISEKFICQKSLLSKGTLAEFEALFDGKLEKHARNDSKTG